VTQPYHIIVTANELLIGMVLETTVGQVYPTARISIVTTGLEVLALEDQSRLDLVISTLNAGVIDGLALTRALRARSDILPVIIISGDCTLEVEANEAGVTLFLCQPELVNKLKAALPKLLPPNDHNANVG
jgi:CheY-like chemotaxis protein